jgi:hypothetical protein
MRKQEPAEHDIRSANRKWSADDVVDLELKNRTMPRPRLLYEYCGGIQPDCSTGLQRILKQPGGPAGSTAEVHCQLRRVYAAAAQQLARFRFVDFGQPPQSRAGAQIIAECVFVGCCSPSLVISQSPIFAQGDPGPGSGGETCLHSGLRDQPA